MMNRERSKSSDCWTSHINHAPESSQRGSLDGKSLNIDNLNPAGLIISCGLTGFTGRVSITENTALYAETCTFCNS